MCSIKYNFYLFINRSRLGLFLLIKILFSRQMSFARHLIFSLISDAFQHSFANPKK